MLDVCINTIVRDGDDTLQFCLESVLPYVKKAILTIDSRTKDKTREVAEHMKKKWKNLWVNEFEIVDPLRDIVVMRNQQINRSTERFIWIVDADEYYPFEAIKNISLTNLNNVYTFQCWAPWNKTHAHRASSIQRIPRIFRNDERQWSGFFGKERFVEALDKIKDFDNRYIHFTHLKKDVWRKEMGMERMADGRVLISMPLEVSFIVQKFYDQKQKMSDV